MLGSSAEVEMAVDLLFHCEVNDSNILFFFSFPTLRARTELCGWQGGCGAAGSSRCWGPRRQHHPTLLQDGLWGKHCGKCIAQNRVTWG